MSVLELTPRQKKLLEVLIHLHRRSGDTVKSEDIAEMIDRDAGTVRNQMPSLKAMQLIESVPGPKGGYEPTRAAYDALEFAEEAPGAAGTVPFVHNSARTDDVLVLEIDLVSVHHPGDCRAEIRLQGSVIPYHTGDTIVVGPTPGSNLVVAGTVVGKDDINSSIILSVDEMRAPADQNKR